MSDIEWLSKIRMIIEHFNKTMLKLITPEKNLSTNESIMLWCGCLILLPVSALNTVVHN